MYTSNFTGKRRSKKKNKKKVDQTFGNGTKIRNHKKIKDLKIHAAAMNSSKS